MSSPLGQRLTALWNARLYGILDAGYRPPEQWLHLTELLISGGVGVLQIRAKSMAPESLEPWIAPIATHCRQHGVPLILNDYPDWAARWDLDGCHLGQDDLPLAEARRILKPQQILGKSTHSLNQAVAAVEEGADYIGFGPIFATPTKPDYTPIGRSDIREMYRRVPIPAFCIGGVKKENAAALAAHGAQKIVVVSGLLNAPDPTTYAQDTLAALAGTDK